MNRRTAPHRPGRPGALMLAALAVALGTVLAAAAAPAHAADGSVGYVRLAHLSPDTPAVDVYLSKPGDTAFKEQVFTHVGYGVMSKYLTLPVGTYAVAMRKQGDPPATPPVLTTQVTVTAGGAYTIAGVGKFAGLGLKVYEDDLNRPTDGKAKVRVIQASVASPILDVGLDNGTPVAQGINFASTTPYRAVSPGTWTLQIKPNGSSSVTTLSCEMQGGSVYTLLVLDGPSGLRLQLLADARSGAQVPDGGVATGAGGTATAYRLTVIGAAGLLLAGLVALALRLRRARAGRP